MTQMGFLPEAKARSQKNSLKMQVMVCQICTNTMCESYIFDLLKLIYQHKKDQKLEIVVICFGTEARVASFEQFKEPNRQFYYIETSI